MSDSNGVVIVDIEKKSTAMLAGLKIGDIILKVDGILVNSDFLNGMTVEEAKNTFKKYEIWRYQADRWLLPYVQIRITFGQLLTFIIDHIYVVCNTVNRIQYYIPTLRVLP